MEPKFIYFYNDEANKLNFPIDSERLFNSQKDLDELVINENNESDNLIAIFHFCGDCINNLNKQYNFNSILSFGYDLNSKYIFLILDCPTSYQLLDERFDDIDIGLLTLESDMIGFGVCISDKNRFILNNIDYTDFRYPFRIMAKFGSEYCNYLLRSKRNIDFNDDAGKVISVFNTETDGLEEQLNTLPLLCDISIMSQILESNINNTDMHVQFDITIKDINNILDQIGIRLFNDEEKSIKKHDSKFSYIGSFQLFLDDPLDFNLKVNIVLITKNNNKIYLIPLYHPITDIRFISNKYHTFLDIYNA